MSTPFYRHRSGFTLLEVLVSTTIMVVIVLTVVTIASDTMRVYERAVADLSTQSEARGVLDALDSDFQSAQLRADNHCWMEIIIPGGSGAPGGAPAAVGNVQPIDQPIIMLFSSPLDRPRWNADAATRRQLKGDVCAIAYRIGQRSPFDMPGEPIQQVYGVYRTIVDSENTFNEALPVILTGTSAAPGSPWNYWYNTARSVQEYGPLTGSPGLKTKPLIDATTTCWTLDEQNFIGSNVVAMNLVLWCTSSMPASVTLPSTAKADPLARLASSLRPVIPAATDAFRFSNNPSVGGYGAVFKGGTAAGLTAAAPLRYAPAGNPVFPVTMPTATAVHPYDYFGGRLRIFADRMYPDNLTPSTVVAAPPFPYMPYALRGVEISVTVLTPDGSKELRGLQQLGGLPKLADPNAFKRIVYLHGRNYTRYIRILSNGG